MRPRSSAIATLVAISMVAALAATVLPPARVDAQPVERVGGAAQAPFTTSVKAGPATVSLEATEVAIPTKGRFDYSVTVRSATPLDYLQVRMRLHMPSGSLVYQKTFVDQSDGTEPRTFTFEREIGDIDLEPGAYPIELSIRVAAPGTRADEVIEGTLLVYDPAAEPRPVSLIARVTALPLTDAEGRFVVDPATYGRARDDVLRLADYVIRDRSARLSLAVSPLMLEEWRRAAGGYRYESPEGAVEVASTDGTPQSYAYTLSRLSEAAATGRLEVLSSGYSDPDLSELEAAELTGDIGPQYAEGISAIYRTIGTTPTAGTAPANGCFSAESADELGAIGIRYAIVSDKCVPLASPGAYSASGGKLKVLVSDEEQASLIAKGRTHAALAGIFERYLENDPGPVPVMVKIGPDGATADSLIAAAVAVSRQSWTSLVLGGSVQQSKEKLSAAALQRTTGLKAPTGHWTTIASSRRFTRAAIAALGPQDEEALLAGRESLIAEAAAWRGVGGDWAHADRALGFARKAAASARSVLGRITLNSKPVTLAGTRGEVPITIVNSGEKVLNVRVFTTPSSGMKQGLSPAFNIAIQPQDNFIEVPVDLQGGLSGSLDVVVMAGDVRIAETTVPLSASIMDRLVILGGIIIVLGTILAFIVTRVRAADRRDHDAPRFG